MKLVFKFVVACLGLGTIVLGSAYLWALQNPNWVKAQVENLLSAEIHRDVHIAGPITLSPGLTTRIAGEGLQISNPDWAQQDHFLETAPFQAAVATFPLLWLDAELVGFEADWVKLSVELLTDGRATVHFDDPEGKPMDDEDSNASGSGFSLENFRFSTTHIVFIDEPLGLSADIRLDHGAGENVAHLSLTGQSMDDPVKLTGAITNWAHLLDPGTATTVTVDGRFGNTDIAGDVTVQNFASLEAWSTDLDISGPDLERFAKRWSVDLPSQASFSGSVHLEEQGPDFGIAFDLTSLDTSQLSGSIKLHEANDEALEIITADVHAPVLNIDDLNVSGTSSAQTRDMQALWPTAMWSAKAKIDQLVASNFSLSDITAVLDAGPDRAEISVTRDAQAEDAVEDIFHATFTRNGADIDTVITAKTGEINFEGLTRALDDVPPIREADIDLRASGQNVQEWINSSEGHARVKTGQFKVGAVMSDLAHYDGFSAFFNGITSLFSTPKQQVQCATVNLQPMTEEVKLHTHIVHGERISTVNATLDRATQQVTGNIRTSAVKKSGFKPTQNLKIAGPLDDLKVTNLGLDDLSLLAARTAATPINSIIDLFDGSDKKAIKEACLDILSHQHDTENDV